MKPRAEGVSRKDALARRGGGDEFLLNEADLPKASCSLISERHLSSPG